MTKMLSIGTQVRTHVNHQDDVLVTIVGYEEDSYGSLGYVVRTRGGREVVRSTASVIA